MNLLLVSASRGIPFGTGKTVIHGYGGMFYMPMQFGFGLVSNIPAYQSYNVNVFQVPLAYPQDNPPLPAGTQNVSIFPQHPRDPVPRTGWSAFSRRSRRIPC